jgi:hypothetical protein
MADSQGSQFYHMGCSPSEMQLLSIQLYVESIFNYISRELYNIKFLGLSSRKKSLVSFMHESKIWD